jgi:hypothetical protein
MLFCLLPSDLAGDLDETEDRSWGTGQRFLGTSTGFAILKSKGDKPLRSIGRIGSMVA